MGLNLLHRAFDEAHRLGIAEVAARFSLDAMPGKQMAIDADLSTGLIDEMLAGPEEPGTELEWTLSYRLKYELNRPSSSCNRYFARHGIRDHLP